MRVRNSTIGSVSVIVDAPCLRVGVKDTFLRFRRVSPSRASTNTPDPPSSLIEDKRSLFHSSDGRHLGVPPLSTPSVTSRSSTARARTAVVGIRDTPYVGSPT